MRFGKALAATVGILASLYCVFLPFEFFSANWANQFDLSILSTNNAICALPSTAALAITKVVILDRARRYFLFLAAPITFYNDRGPEASATTKLCGLGAIWLNIERLSARLANHRNIIFVHSYIVPRMSLYASCGKEIIAEARLAHHCGQHIQHPLFQAVGVDA